jgi:hypothetical protein
MRYQSHIIRLDLVLEIGPQAFLFVIRRVSMFDVLTFVMNLYYCVGLIAIEMRYI